MKVPSPLNGWRIFWGEVGIIVIGVLLALGAQQLVEAMSWRGQVRDFRLAVDKELGENLSIYQIRLRQNDCVSRRLAEVERLLVIPDGQTPMRLRRISEVDNYTFYFSVWDNKDAAVTAHLPVDVRSRYAQIYDEFRNADHQRASENDTWRSINQFNLPEPLTHADRLRLSELLAYARQIDSNRRYNWDAAVVGMTVRPSSRLARGAKSGGFAMFALSISTRYWRKSGLNASMRTAESRAEWRLPANYEKSYGGSSLSLKRSR